jgi:hypothetical protein
MAAVRRGGFAVCFPSIGSVSRMLPIHTMPSLPKLPSIGRPPRWARTATGVIAAVVDANATSAALRSLKVALESRSMTAATENQTAAQIITIQMVRAPKRDD